MSLTPVHTVRSHGGLTPKQRDLLLLNIFVLTQHGYFDRAGALAEAMHMLGDESPEVQLARAVMRFTAKDWAGALACLEEVDRIDPIERFGSYTLSDKQRLRRYLKARCLYEMEDVVRARDAVEAYLRRGAAGAGGAD